jgi:hypothetical protein
VPGAEAITLRCCVGWRAGYLDDDAASRSGVPAMKRKIGRATKTRPRMLMEHLLAAVQYRAGSPRFNMWLLAVLVVFRRQQRCQAP